MAGGRGGSARLDEALVHTCGREFFTAASYAIHAKHCSGKPAEGRIAARDRALVAQPAEARRLGRRQVRVRIPPRARRKNGHADRTPPAAALSVIQGAATDKAIEIVLAGLRARRDAIDNAIAALQAVG